MKKKEGVAINAAKVQATASDAAAVAEALAPCQAVIEHQSPADLKPNPRNARTHSEKQVQLLAAAVKEFGVFVPVVVDENDVILAGHARLEAAKLLGMAKVPTIRVKHLTPERKRAFVLADNRLAEMAGWDDELLGAELGELSGLELDFDFEITGFDTVDIDRLEARTAEQSVEQEVVPELDRKEPTVSAAGDLWQLGDHRVFCGSALEEESYRHLLGDERVQLVFSDPPYNVPIDGHVCGLGSVRHAEFKMASGEMSDEEFVAFLERFMRLAAAHSVDGAIHFLCMDWRHMGQMLEAARPIYGPAKNLCVWVKTNAGMGTFYRSQHEMVFVFKVGTGKHINNFGLGERGRHRSNVWTYPGVNTFKRGRMDELGAHPTVKPLAMVIDALKDCSRRRGIVLDPFVGSGTTLLAAEKTGRIGRAIELDPHYVDVAIRRWQDLTGRSAIHVDSGRSFDELAAGSGRQAA
jgi:DNA methylase/ParB-like nuclease domain